MGKQEKIGDRLELVKDYFRGLSDFHNFRNSITVDFLDFAMWDSEFAQELLDNFDENRELFIMAFKELKEIKGVVFVFFKNVKGADVELRNIRAEHVDKLVSVRVQVFQKSTIVPETVELKFECPSCGNIMSLKQIGVGVSEPTRCGCGRKGKFKVVKEILVDVQNLIVRELDILGVDTPKDFNVFLYQDMCSPFSDARTTINANLILYGVVRAITILDKRGIEKRRKEIIIEAVGVDYLDENVNDLVLNEIDIKEIRAVASRVDVFGFLVRQFDPGILGWEEVKLGGILSLFGGSHVIENGKIDRHGHIHILAIGDPGGGKSHILNKYLGYAPKSGLAVGKGASGVGLTAGVEKNDFIGGWMLVPGALALANKGHVGIDELDKIDKEEVTSLNQAMSNQEIKIDKASIHSKLSTDTTVFACCNPKFGRFDSHDHPLRQFNIDNSLLNRFVLIFVMRETTKDEVRSRIWSKILDVHQHNVKCDDDVVLDRVFWKKYISFARKNFNPTIPLCLKKDMLEELELLNKANQGLGSLAIGNRQVEGIIKLAEASARVRLSNDVDRDDISRAINLMLYSLKQICVDETGKLDADIINVGVGVSERNSLHLLRDAFFKMEKTFIGRDMFSTEELMEETGLEGNKIELAITKLKNTGDIYEPRCGFFKRLG